MTAQLESILGVFKHGTDDVFGPRGVTRHLWFDSRQAIPDSTMLIVVLAEFVNDTVLVDHVASTESRLLALTWIHC